jgi:hypothetical protein
MTKLLERAIKCDDGDRLPKITQNALAGGGVAII